MKIFQILFIKRHDLLQPMVHPRLGHGREVKLRQLGEGDIGVVQPQTGGELNLLGEGGDDFLVQDLTASGTGLLLLDVIPLSFAIETAGGVATRVIERNTTLPIRYSQVFTTKSMLQRSVKIHVVQGERQFARDNKSLGMFRLDGIPPAMRGVPQIEVTFDIDSNGILNVSAKDKATGKSQSIRIEASSGLSEEEIKRMKAEAEANADADKKERERVDKLNAADSMIFQTEKQMKEYGDKLPADKKAEIEGALGKLKTAHQAQDIAGIDAAMAEMNAIWQKASEEMYKNAGAQGGPQDPNAGQNPNNGNDDVTDVDFEEVK